MNNLLVKAKPLSKLCEYNAGDLPEGYKSDCYGNVDETQWACKEKRRILVSVLVSPSFRSFEYKTFYIHKK